MGFIGKAIGDVLGTNSDYQYDTQGIDYGNLASKGISDATNSYNQQQTLANMLMQQANGAGPNPALQQLKQQTALNNAQAAGLVASQKGINPALASMLASQNASNANQNAAGQAATLQAQQQLASQGGLANVLANMSSSANQRTALGIGANQTMNSANQSQSQSNAANMAGLWDSIAGSATKSMTGGSGATPVGKAHGGMIPGSAPIPGDSPKNDTVPAMLSPGEIVVPRSKADDPQKAKAFIDELMGRGKKQKVSYNDILLAKRKLESVVSELQKLGVK